VGGLALRRHRHATLLHGTLLVDADLEQIAALLKHPVLEPKWRQGRSHLAFLANLGRLDVAAFTNALKPIQAVQS
jgi:lipoate-protein ligase A